MNPHGLIKKFPIGWKRMLYAGKEHINFKCLFPHCDFSNIVLPSKTNAILYSNCKPRSYPMSLLLKKLQTQITNLSICTYLMWQPQLDNILSNHIVFVYNLLHIPKVENSTTTVKKTCQKGTCNQKKKDSHSIKFILVLDS